MKRPSIIFVMIMLMISLPATAQDTPVDADSVFLFNGEVYVGTITLEDAQRVVVQTSVGLAELNKKAVSRIVYHTGQIKLFKDTRTKEEMLRDVSFARILTFFLVVIIIAAIL